MTNEQLCILLELTKERVESEIDAIETELVELGAERYLHWYNKETGARALYFGHEPNSDEYETKPTGNFKALTGLRNLVLELGRYSKSLERPRGEKW